MSYDVARNVEILIHAPYLPTWWKIFSSHEKLVSPLPLLPAIYILKGLIFLHSDGNGLDKHKLRISLVSEKVGLEKARDSMMFLTR